MRDHGRHGTGRGGEEKGAGRENEQERGNGYALGKMGQLGHTHGELVDFHLLVLTFSFWFFFVFISPLPRSNNGRKTPQWWAGPY